jgi:uncharacterized membrane protein YdjX (TVP38/TMEM64 family)
MQRLFHWLMSGRRALLATLFLCLIAVVWVTLHRSGGMEALVAQEIRLRDWIDSNPVWAFAIGLGVYTAASFVPGTGGKAIAVGWLYGFWRGVLLVEVALSTAALGSFLFSRFLLRDAIRRRYVSFVERLDDNLLKRPALYVLMLRLAHVPYTVVNYTLGATKIPVRTFLWTTALGLLPGTMVFVFAGLRLPTLAELIQEGAWGLLDPWLIAALALSAVLAPLVHLIADRWKQSVSAADPKGQEAEA